MGDLLIDTPSGAKVALSTLADLVKDTGPNTISREQVERKIVVPALYLRFGRPVVRE